MALPSAWLEKWYPSTHQHVITTSISSHPSKLAAAFLTLSDMAWLMEQRGVLVDESQSALTSSSCRLCSVLCPESPPCSPKRVFTSPPATGEVKAPWDVSLEKPGCLPVLNIDKIYMLWKCRDQAAVRIFVENFYWFFSLFYCVLLLWDW